MKDWNAITELLNCKIVNVNGLISLPYKYGTNYLTFVIIFWCVNHVVLLCQIKKSLC